jgi:hypothetical protein
MALFLRTPTPTKERRISSEAEEANKALAMLDRTKLHNGHRTAPSSGGGRSFDGHPITSVLSPSLVAPIGAIPFEDFKEWMNRLAQTTEEERARSLLYYANWIVAEKALAACDELLKRYAVG